MSEYECGIRFRCVPRQRRQRCFGEAQYTADAGANLLIYQVKDQLSFTRLLSYHYEPDCIYRCLRVGVNFAPVL